jgi:ribosomal protein S18 acetylase RimI-like enzyme
MRESGLEPIPATVEIAGLADLRAMAELRYENIRQRFPKKDLSNDDPEKLVEEFTLTVEKNSEDEYYLVAKDNGKVVGMCGMFWHPDEKKFQFTSFYTLSELKDRKIGGRVFRSARDRAQQNSHHPVGMYLVTREHNPDAQERYKHWGFKETGRDGHRIRMDLDFGI